MDKILKVKSFKYLGIIINDKLTFDNNDDMLIKKSQQRLFCLRRLAKFQVDRFVMTVFYKSFVESVFTFSFICWFAPLSLKKLINKDNKSQQENHWHSAKKTTISQN